MRVTKVLRVAVAFSVTVETDDGEEFEVLIERKLEPELHFTEATYGDHAADVGELRGDEVEPRTENIVIEAIIRTEDEGKKLE